MRFRTQAFGAADRLGAFEAALGERLTAAECRIIGPADRFGVDWRQTAGTTVAVARARVTGLEAVRRPSALHAEADPFTLYVKLHGAAQLSPGDARHILGDGEAMVIDAARPARNFWCDAELIAIRASPVPPSARTSRPLPQPAAGSPPVSGP